MSSTLAVYLALKFTGLFSTLAILIAFSRDPSNASWVATATVCPIRVVFPVIRLATCSSVVLGCSFLISCASLSTEICSDFRPRCARLRCLRLAGVTFVTFRHHDISTSVINLVSPSLDSSRHLICAGVGTVRRDSVRHVAGASIGWR